MRQPNSPRSVPQYGGRPISYSTEPLLIRQSEARFIETSLTELLKQVEEFTAIALRDRPLLKELGLPEDLDGRPTPLGLHVPFARFDIVYDGTKMNVLELNTDGTAGWNISEWIAEEAQIKEVENPNLRLSQRLLNAILEHAPKSQEVVLVDFPGQGTSWEQHDLVKRWKPNMACHVADPAFRSWKPGALAYRRALSWQLRSGAERAKPFLDDWKNGAITVVGTWTSDVGMSKAWPAFVRSKFLPETLLMEAEATSRMTNEKDDWVLKGALSYSGHSVVRGMDLTPERWVAALSNALKETEAGRPWIAQQRVEVPRAEGKPYELGVYFLNGKPAGYMGRWGHEAHISETSDEILRPIRITP